MAEQVSQYRCPECGAVFPDSLGFAAHLKTHQLYRGAQSTTEKQEIQKAYYYTNKEMSWARIPIVGLLIDFIAAFFVISAFRSGSSIPYLPVFLIFVIGNVLAWGALMKWLVTPESSEPSETRVH